jgi:predicted nucleic acid-binding protein
MSYLIDTNVLSELRRIKADKNVLSWSEKIPLTAMYISVLTLGEIRKGIELLSDLHRKEALKIWLEHTLPAQFGERVLEINLSIAERWGRLQAEAKRPLPVIDSLLAATALHYDLCLITRNVSDFNYPGLEIINPWDA